jgi:hypothetical protein
MKVARSIQQRKQGCIALLTALFPFLPVHYRCLGSFHSNLKSFYYETLEEGKDYKIPNLGEEFYWRLTIPLKKPKSSKL